MTMIDYPTIEIINNVYAIDYIENNNSMSSRRMNRSLEYMGIDLRKVIFSVCYNKETKSTWIVAAIKYYDENDVEKIIKCMIENYMYDEYFIGNI